MIYENITTLAQPSPTFSSKCSRLDVQHGPPHGRPGQACDGAWGQAAFVQPVWCEDLPGDVVGMVGMGKNGLNMDEWLENSGVKWVLDALGMVIFDVQVLKLGCQIAILPSAASSGPSHWFSDVFRQSRFIDSQLHRRRLSSVLFRCVALCCASVAVWGALRTSWSPKSNLRVLTLQHISSEETILCGAILQHLNIAKTTNREQFVCQKYLLRTSNSAWFCDTKPLSPRRPSHCSTTLVAILRQMRSMCFWRFRTPACASNMPAIRRFSISWFSLGYPPKKNLVLASYPFSLGWNHDVLVLQIPIYVGYYV